MSCKSAEDTDRHQPARDCRALFASFESPEGRVGPMVRQRRRERFGCGPERSPRQRIDTARITSRVLAGVVASGYVSGDDDPVTSRTAQAFRTVMPARRALHRMVRRGSLRDVRAHGPVCGNWARFVSKRVSIPGMRPPARADLEAATPVQKDSPDRSPRSILIRLKRASRFSAVPSAGREPVRSGALRRAAGVGDR